MNQAVTRAREQGKTLCGTSTLGGANDETTIKHDTILLLLHATAMLALAGKVENKVVNMSLCGWRCHVVWHGGDCCLSYLLPSARFSHSTSSVMVSSVSMSKAPVATPVLPAAVTRVGREIPCCFGRTVGREVGRRSQHVKSVEIKDRNKEDATTAIEPQQHTDKNAKNG